MKLRQLYLFASAILTCALLGVLLAAPASALPEKFFGMTAHESMNDSEPDWNALQHAGVQRFRMQIKWQTINEAGGGGASGWKNESGWVNTYDRYFEKAAKHGIAILPYIYTRKEGSPQYYWTGEPAFPEWKQFVWTVVQRYGQAGSFWKNHSSIPQYPVEYWEVWNEPNLSLNCPANSCNGKEYGEFLVQTSKTIHEAQSAIYADTAKVLFGGLYQERWNYPVTSYLASAGQAAGINTAYDGLSLHPYAFGRQGETTRSFAEKAAAVSYNVNEAYDAQNNGIGASKPIWVTEVGWPVDGTEAQHVTPSEQAGLLNEAYNWLKQASASIYNVKYAAWYFYKDVSSDPKTGWALHAGLRTANGAFRPSWWAYQGQTGAAPWPGGQVAFQSSSTQLFTYSNAMGSATTGLGMAAGTSPDVETLTNGEYLMGLQANTKSLWVSSPAGGSGNTFLAMAAGTSPSVTWLPEQGSNQEEWEMAFQANDGGLWVRSSSTAFGNTYLGMKAGTSPSITTLPNGEWQAAFQANDGGLWVRSASGAFGNTYLGMKAGTSPSITTLSNGEWEAAFQANDGGLWVRSSSGAYGNTGFGMAPGTSPSITTLPNGEWEVAFQGSDGRLWTRYASGTYENTGLAMAPGTSPSISPPDRWVG
jgi:hypothetical protein